MVEALAEAGGDWANGAGGYVGTWGDNGDCYRNNGNNGISESRSSYTNTEIGGVSTETYRGFGDDAASYFTYGLTNNTQYTLGTNAQITVPQVGGQGGVLYWMKVGNCGLFATSSGGKAGNGGNITASAKAIVYAYNGDRITDDSYDEPIYDYDKDGNKLSTTCKVIIKHGTSEKISPIKIFAQAGILREVRYTNIAWEQKPTSGEEYFRRIFGEQLEESVKNIKRATEYGDIENHIIRAEQLITPLNYTNPETKEKYGIGSGAGYMEVSNGTYTVDESLDDIL